MENLRNQKWETSYKKATSTCHFILRQIRSHSLCFPRHECRIWVLWNWLTCFPCPRCIFIRRNFRTENFNTNPSIITGDVKYGIKIPTMSCFLFIILASDLIWSGAKIFTKMRKAWMNSYAIFLLSAKNRWGGGHMCHPRGVRGLTLARSGGGLMQPPMSFSELDATPFG